MHILQPLLDVGDLMRSKPVLTLLATIAFIAVISPYFFAQGAADWLRRSLSLLVIGGVGAIVLIALAKITYSSFVGGDYAFGAIFASSAVLFVLFVLAILAVMAFRGQFETPFLFLSLVASLFLSLILSTGVTLARRLFL